MTPAQYILFFAVCVIIVYLLNCLIARRFITIEPKLAAVYASTLVLIGIFGELFVNKSYELVVGHPLWTYQVAPVHGGLSSRYAFFLWAIYGFHLYLLHEAPTGPRFNAGKYTIYVFGLEGVLMELITNSLFILLFHRYLYYYPANDLWHLTSLQAFPCYVAGEWVITSALKRFRLDPKFFVVMNLLLASVVVFLV